MDDKLHILYHLYGEVEDPDALERLLDDKALRAEYEAMQSVKERLDARPLPRPDAAVIDRVVAAATASPVAGPARRMDRPPRSRAVRRLRLFGAVSTVLALLLVVSISVVQWRTGALETASLRDAAPQARQELAASAAEPPREEAAPAPSEAEEEAPAPSVAGARPEMLARRDQAAPPPPEAAPSPDAERARTVVADALTSARPQAGAAKAVGEAEADEATEVDEATEADEAAIPSWDEQGELLRLHRRIELLEARSAALNWDESAVMSLDSIPSANPDARRGLNPAGRQRPPDH